MTIDKGKRIALVTGATGAIGEAIARGLAADPAHSLVLGVRNAAKGERAAARIRQNTKNDAVRCEVVDVSLKSSVDAFAARWSGPLHVLVNNAAVAPRSRVETENGIELQLATNVLGYFWMTSAFRATLAESSPSTIVNVASYWAGDLDLDDLEFQRRTYDSDRAYRQSKQANRMLTVTLADRLESQRISVNACHPGDVSSTLSNDLGFGGHESPDTAAATPVWLALGGSDARATGRYFERKQESPCRFSADRSAIDTLHAKCAAYR